MDYQNRIKLITGGVNNFLRGFVRPAHLCDDLAIGEIRAIAEEINSLCSPEANADMLSDRMEACFREIRRTHKSREWPVCAVFVAALKAINAKQTAPEPEKPLPVHSGRGKDRRLEAAAFAMNAGRPVGEGYLYGWSAVALIRNGLVTQDVLDAYREGFLQTMRHRVGSEYAELVKSRLLARHQACLEIINGKGAVS